MSSGCAIVLAFIGTMFVCIFIGVALGIESSFFVSVITLLMCFIVTGLVIKHYNGQESSKQEQTEKPVEEMTPAEKAKKLRLAEMMFEHGDITFMQYDLLKAKYTGEKSYTETHGIDMAMAASKKISADMAIEKHKKDTEKSIVLNAAVGNAVGGLGGTIIGAATAAGKSNIKTQELLAQQDKANAEFEAALNRKVNAGGWLCSCGRSNASYVSTCVCGTNKRDIM